jgi:uncharacterized membrane protein (DUF106 family)
MPLNILDTLFNPILALPPVVGILIVSILVSVITLLAYKFLTNQTLMKQLRDEINEFQKEAKELRNHPEKAMKVQTEMMETNSKYMMESMKPTLFTFIPILIIFAWLNTHMAYYPLQPGMPFEVSLQYKAGTVGEAKLTLPEGMSTEDETVKKILNNKVTWVVSGKSGTYNMTFESPGIKVDKDVLITTQKTYAPPVKAIKNLPLTQIAVGNERVHPFGGLSLFGWQPGWLGTYVIFSLFFSITLRKLFKIY